MHIFLGILHLHYARSPEWGNPQRISPKEAEMGKYKEQKIPKLSSSGGKLKQLAGRACHG